MHAKAVTSKTESEIANRQSHGATFAKAVNGRKQPVRGLWRRGDRCYAQLTVEDPFTGQKKVRRVSLCNAEGEPVQTVGTRKWTFAADTGERTPEGKPIWLKLVYATNTKIRRHVKIRAEANPFDPDWHGYFEERAFFKKFGIPSP